MKITVRKTTAEEVDVKVIELHAKCRDLCDIRICDGEGSYIHEHDGYVPEFFPGDHYGDYIILDIDIETGQILNWPKITEDQLEKFINKEEEY